MLCTNSDHACTHADNHLLCELVNDAVKSADTGSEISDSKKLSISQKHGKSLTVTLQQRKNKENLTPKCISAAYMSEIQVKFGLSWNTSCV